MSKLTKMIGVMFETRWTTLGTDMPSVQNEESLAKVTKYNPHQVLKLSASIPVVNWEGKHIFEVQIKVVLLET